MEQQNGKGAVRRVLIAVAFLYWRVTTYGGNKMTRLVYFMGLNSRYERAYSDAIAKAPGATGLIDVTLREDWYWWFIGTARCVTLNGEAIK